MVLDSSEKAIKGFVGVEKNHVKGGTGKRRSNSFFPEAFSHSQPTLPSPPPQLREPSLPVLGKDGQRAVKMSLDRLPRPLPQRPAPLH